MQPTTGRFVVRRYFHAQTTATPKSKLHGAARTACSVERQHRNATQPLRATCIAPPAGPSLSSAYHVRFGPILRRRQARGTGRANEMRPTSSLACLPTYICGQAQQISRKSPIPKGVPDSQTQRPYDTGKQPAAAEANSPAEGLTMRPLSLSSTPRILVDRTADAGSLDPASTNVGSG